MSGPFIATALLQSAGGNIDQRIRRRPVAIQPIPNGPYYGSIPQWYGGEVDPIFNTAVL